MMPFNWLTTFAMLLLATGNTFGPRLSFKELALPKGIGVIKTANLIDGRLKLLAFDQDTAKVTLLVVNGDSASVEGTVTLKMSASACDPYDVGPEFALTSDAAWAVGCTYHGQDQESEATVAQIVGNNIRYISLQRHNHHDIPFLASPCKDGGIGVAGKEQVSSNQVVDQPLLWRVDKYGMKRYIPPQQINTPWGGYWPYSEVRVLVDCTVLLGASYISPSFGEEGEEPAVFWVAHQGRADVLVRGVSSGSPWDADSATISGNSLYTAGYPYEPSDRGSQLKVMSFSLWNFAKTGEIGLPIVGSDYSYLTSGPSDEEIAAVASLGNKNNYLFLLKKDLRGFKSYPIEDLPYLEGALGTKERLILYGGSNDAFVGIVNWPAQ